MTTTRKSEKPIRTLLQVNQGNWCQESYETAGRDAGRRALQLRKLGYRVTCGSIGYQRTPMGQLKLTLVDIRPGTNADTTGLPVVERIRL